MADGSVQFSPLVMFTCTYVTKLEHLHVNHEHLTHVLEPSGAVVALNSNFGHKSQVGYEKFLKKAKLDDKYVGGRELLPIRCKRRKPQGDASCFNSALEAIILLRLTTNQPQEVKTILSTNCNKYYAIKSFPTTGQTQIPGVIAPNLADGPFIAHVWADFLNQAQVSNNIIILQNPHPIMINFKFCLINITKKLLIDLPRVYEWMVMRKLANKGLPYPICEIKAPIDGHNLSFKLLCPIDDLGNTKKVRIKMFYRGKINILGASNFKMVEDIYITITTHFNTHSEHVAVIPDQD